MTIDGPVGNSFDINEVYILHAQGGVVEGWRCRYQCTEKLCTAVDKVDRLSMEKKHTVGVSTR